jgi:hypothetical protein
MRVLILLLLAAPLFAAPSDPLELVPPAARDKLTATGEVSEFSDSFDKLSLAHGSALEPAMAALMAHRQSTLAAEAFFWIETPKDWTPETAPARLFRALTAVSTMKNLEVYSESLKRMETFIFDAYRVGSPSKKDRLPDPAITADSKTEFTLFENEEQTGEGFSRYSFSAEPGWYQVTQTNLTSLNYGIIPLVAPHDLLTVVFVVPGKDHILVYGATAAKTFSLFGLERSRTASLYNRMKALVTWFRNNLAAPQ